MTPCITPFAILGITRFAGVMTSPYFLQPRAAAAARRFDFGARVFF
jgi:hypothetical protein